MKTLQIIALGLLAGFTGSWIFQTWHEGRMAEVTKAGQIYPIRWCIPRSHPPPVVTMR